MILESVRKHAAAIPQVPSRLLLGAGALTSFAVLLANDMVHPLVVYALQLYLSF
ncbi:MAG TPA: hypothetical protein VEG34_04070 [Thermoanaerobaculia bacterium]|jgi:hypothetical protein|nr:hypothetical protein [Thermoanaerobaculia bacterium]